MSLTTFTTGLSGLNANATGLSVVGNNLANLNTVGFKGANISFVDVLGESFMSGGNSSSAATANLGLGTQVSSVRTSFTAGSIQSTNNPLDVAIQGSGFFVVNNDGQRMYSRAGNLRLDSSNNLIGDTGFPVMGYVRNPATNEIDPNLGLRNIQIPSGIESPVRTSTFQIDMNLDANAPEGTRFTTAFQVYDSLGVAHTATMTMQKGASGGDPATSEWNFDVTIPNNQIAGVDASNTKQFSLITGDVAVDPPAAGTLVFDSNGNLASAYVGDEPAALPDLANLSIPASGVSLPGMASGGSLSSSMSWQLLKDDGTAAVSAFASASEVTFSSQNGAGAGTLNSLSILEDGTLSASFTNGKTVDFGRVVLAQFSNLDGLASSGSGLFRETRESGAALYGEPGNGGRGRLISGALEMSNVDLATELTKIITFQRGYQANARMISLTDQIMQETLNLRN